MWVADTTAFRNGGGRDDRDGRDSPRWFACDAGHRCGQLLTRGPGARQARWKHIMQTSGAGREVTCATWRLGRDGDVRRARPSLQRRELTTQMMSTTPCL